MSRSMHPTSSWSENNDTSFRPPLPPHLHRQIASSSNQSYPISSRPSPQLEFPPPVTPPHLTHSRRGSRESGETSSSNSTPHSGTSGVKPGIVPRVARSSGSDSSPLHVSAGRKRKVRRRGEADDDEEAFTDEEIDPGVAQKLRKEDAKKSRQDAEQKRRDQLKMSYDELRKWVPGSTEKTSKVQLVGHATKHIVKLKAEKEDLLQQVEALNRRVQTLQEINEKLCQRMIEAGLEVGPAERGASMQAPAPPMHHEVHPSSMPPPQPAPPIDHTMVRPGHSRNSSAASATHPLGMQTPGAPSASPFPPSGYPLSTISTPSSPMKAAAVPPSAAMPPPGPRPHLHLPHNSVPSAPSPLSSASSASRQSGWSPEVSSSARFYGSNSSASSSGVSLVGGLSLSEHNGPPSPHFSNPGYTEGSGAPMNTHPYAIPPHHTQMYRSPGLGLETDRAEIAGNANSAPDEGYHPTGEGGMSQIPMGMDPSQPQYMSFGGAGGSFVFPPHSSDHPHPSAFNGVDESGGSSMIGAYPHSPELTFDFQPSQSGHLSFQQELAQEPTPPPTSHHLESNAYLATASRLQAPSGMGVHNHLSYLSSPHGINAHSPSLSVHSPHSHSSTTPRNMTGVIPPGSVASPRSPGGYQDPSQLTNGGHGESTACISPSMLISDPVGPSDGGNELKDGGEVISVGGGSWYGS
ncbi:hypothetical protein FRC03_012366 [Tulasnella sp. 419]|nr:hypothetical protein FRC03_012366 [Tulasnella sp. 419]